MFQVYACLQVRHIVLLLCQFVNHIEVVRLPVYHPSEQEKEDPKLYASNVRKLLATEVCDFSRHVYLLIRGRFFVKHSAPLEPEYLDSHLLVLMQNPNLSGFLSIEIY